MLDRFVLVLGGVVGEARDLAPLAVQLRVRTQLLGRPGAIGPRACGFTLDVVDRLAIQLVKRACCCSCCGVIVFPFVGVARPRARLLASARRVARCSVAWLWRSPCAG